MNLQDNKQNLTIINDLKTLLSTRKLPFSQIKINRRYYLNGKNNFELNILGPNQNKDDQTEYHYPHKIDLDIESDGSIKFNSLVQLIKLLSYFDVGQKTKRKIISQFLGLTSLKIKLFCQDKSIKRVKALINAYSNHLFNHEYLKQIKIEHEMFLSLSKEYKIFKAGSIPHKIFEIQFLPLDFDLIEKALLEDQRQSITSKQQQDFLFWKESFSVSGTRNINVFLNKFDLKDSKYTESWEVQEFIDTNTNNYPTQEEFNQLTLGSKKYSYLSHYNNKNIRVSYKEMEKVFVEMRNVNGKMRLATKNSQIKHIQYLFEQVAPSNNMSYHIINAYKQIIQKKKPLFCFYLDIKDLCMNIDYDILEHVLGFTYLSEYLRQRNVYHVDQEYDEVTQLNLSKGIFIGEVFTPTIVSIVCNLIKDTIEESIKKGLKALGVAASNLYVYKYQDDFLIKVFDTDVPYYTSSKCYDYLADFEDTHKIQQLLDFVKVGLRRIGFEINESKVRVLLQRKGRRLVWKLSDEGCLVSCDDFVLLKQDMLNSTALRQENNENTQILMNKLIQQHTDDTNFINIYSLLEQYVLIKMIKRFLKQRQQKLDFIEEIVLNEILKKFTKNVNFFKRQVDFDELSDY